MQRRSPGTTKCKFDAIHLKRTGDSTPDVYEHLPMKMAANAVKRVGKITVSAVKEIGK